MLGCFSKKEYRILLAEKNKLTQEIEELKRENLSLKEQCFSLLNANNELLKKVSEFQPVSAIWAIGVKPTKPLPKEDKNNIVIFYDPGQRGHPNRRGYEQVLHIGGRVYSLIIDLCLGEGRTWEIRLEGFMSALIPKGYTLKAFDDKGQDFVGNEVTAPLEVDSISLYVELEEGEGLRFKISPDTDKVLDSKIFWFY